MKAKSKFTKYIATIISLLVFYIAWMSISIISYSNERKEVVSDAAIVLGAGIDNDKPSPVFRERINHAINLYKQGKVRYLIFTGGLGKGEILTESEVARIYAIKNGVLSKDIFIEKTSTITYENLTESRKILNNNKINSVLVVSDPLHMKRAMTMAKDLGLVANTAPTPTSMYKSWNKKIDFLAREIYFYTGYFLSRVFS